VTIRIRSRPFTRFSWNALPYMRPGLRAPPCYLPRIHRDNSVQISITLRTTTAGQMEYGGS
jgi:hypothetical protein